MLAMPSGPGALYGLSLLTAAVSWSSVISVHSSTGSGYWYVSGTDDVAGGGGKRVRARRALFSSLVAASVSFPSEDRVLRVGIRDFPPSPPGFVMYLLAIQTSLPAISSSHSFQCVSLVDCISLSSSFSFSLSRVWLTWSGSALNLYACLRRCLSLFTRLVRSLVHHHFWCGWGLVFGTSASTVLRSAVSRLRAAVWKASTLSRRGGGGVLESVLLIAELNFSQSTSW